ncbi:MAG: hypothetical protein ACJAQ6_000561 [Arenicella sp.]|jgi:hypothetical protein
MVQPIVAAFDPQRASEDRFPTRRNGVLIVRAEHMNSKYSSEFTAPGKRIVVALESGYSLMSGHSVVTVYTTGVLALLAQRYISQPDGWSGGWQQVVKKLATAEVSSASNLLGLKIETN